MKTIIKLMAVIAGAAYVQYLRSEIDAKAAVLRYVNREHDKAVDAALKAVKEHNAAIVALADLQGKSVRWRTPDEYPRPGQLVVGLVNYGTQAMQLSVFWYSHNHRWMTHNPTGINWNTKETPDYWTPLPSMPSLKETSNV